jgi:hypothetical protein
MMMRDQRIEDLMIGEKREDATEQRKGDAMTEERIEGGMREQRRKTDALQVPTNTVVPIATNALPLPAIPIPAENAHLPQTNTPAADPAQDPPVDTNNQHPPPTPNVPAVPFPPRTNPSKPAPTARNPSSRRNQTTPTPVSWRKNPTR